MGINREAEVDSLSARAKMAIQIFFRSVFAIFATNAPSMPPWVLSTNHPDTSTTTLTQNDKKIKKSAYSLCYTYTKINKQDKKGTYSCALHLP